MLELVPLVKHDEHRKITVVDFGEEEPEISEEFQKKLDAIRKGKFTEYDSVEAMLKDLGLKA